jgi:hypothetical protein
MVVLTPEDLKMPPEPNLVIRFGDNPGFVVPIRVSETAVMRLKWWLFSKFFPIHYEWTTKAMETLNNQKHKP